jgi:hypothetical protein
LAKATEDLPERDLGWFLAVWISASTTLWNRMMAEIVKPWIWTMVIGLKSRLEVNYSPSSFYESFCQHISPHDWARWIGQLVVEVKLKLKLNVKMKVKVKPRCGNRHKEVRTYSPASITFPW